MNWFEFISGVYAMNKHEPGRLSRPVFHPPASIEDIAHLETQLQTKLPVELRALLVETNGVMEMLAIDEGDWFENQWLIPPVSQIISNNRRLRRDFPEGSLERWFCDRESYERTFNDLLVLADAGVDGILFVHAIGSERIAEPNVLAWYPIEDELTQIAPNLGDFIDGWVTGRITV